MSVYLYSTAASAALRALSPLDGRYAADLTPLAELFSEQALFKHKVAIELSWLKALSALPGLPITPLTEAETIHLEAWSASFSWQDALRIKQLEKTTQHDIKAVEYFIKEKLDSLPGLGRWKEMVHFACTSEDINNLAYGLSLSAYRDGVALPVLNSLKVEFTGLADAHADQPLLGMTHGQPASPSTFGKEMAVFAARLTRQIHALKAVQILGKCNGAVGGFNAHHLAYPEVDWLAFTDRFIEALGLTPNHYTTQIEPHDGIAEYCHVFIRINAILMDACRDIWGYLSRGLLGLTISKGQIGSSTMPHKTNPIHFEQAEGNLGLANALLSFLAETLPASRFQRDLTDSTKLRNLGVALGYSQLACQACLKGLKTLFTKPLAFERELSEHWEVLTEAVQILMRQEGLWMPYEQVKTLSQGQTLSKEALHAFIQASALSEKNKAILLALEPKTYLGLSKHLAKNLKDTAETNHDLLNNTE